MLNHADQTSTLIGETSEAPDTEAGVEEETASITPGFVYQFAPLTRRRGETGSPSAPGSRGLGNRRRWWPPRVIGVIGWGAPLPTRGRSSAGWWSTRRATKAARPTCHHQYRRCSAWIKAVNATAISDRFLVWI